MTGSHVKVTDYRAERDPSVTCTCPRLAGLFVSRAQCCQLLPTEAISRESLFVPEHQPSRPGKILGILTEGEGIGLGFRSPLQGLIYRARDIPGHFDGMFIRLNDSLFTTHRIFSQERSFENMNSNPLIRLLLRLHPFPAAYSIWIMS
jgi:hypothetical protein